MNRKNRIGRELFPEPDIPAREEKIVRTIEASLGKLAAAQGEESLGIWEFLYLQSRFIKKYWWGLQAVLLAYLYWRVRSLTEAAMIRQALGVGAPLFVILVIPEVWKNSSSNALDVEATTMYTLRQVYSARLMLFAGVDLLLLTVFCLGTTASSLLSFWELLTQFLVPLNVTCCICLTCLYCPGVGNQSFSMMLCLIFAMAWKEIVQNESLYQAITVPAWAGMLGASLVYMGYCVFRGQRSWKKQLTAKLIWN